MVRRISTYLRIDCANCGARGEVRIEEDDVRGRLDHPENVVETIVKGPFEKKGEGYRCTRCGE